MILSLLLSTLLIWVILMKILVNIIQINKHKILIVFDDTIAWMFSNKNLQPTATESFIKVTREELLQYLSKEWGMVLNIFN